MAKSFAIWLAIIGLAIIAAGCQRSTPGPVTPAPPPASITDPREVHLADLRQLTFSGENAEAYWSHDGTQLILQHTARQEPGGPATCDRIMTISASESGATLEPISSGKGRTTCPYFMPGDRRVIYSSTFAPGNTSAGEACPAVPDRSQGYVWPLYDSYEIYGAPIGDLGALTPLTNSPGYDAEATVCSRDGSILFTSVRDGDLELYRMDPDGKNVVRLTHSPGYDGGAFFSRDCSKIVWRASRPTTPEALADYQGLLAKQLVRPSKMELWVANADGSEARQITYLGAASFAPYFFPSGERVIFSSNAGDPKGREFDLWAINVDGSQLERITFSGGFDGFPMFSPDGTRLAFSSNRNQAAPGDTNVFVARWVDAPPARGATTPTLADEVLADVRFLADDARGGRGVGTAGLDAARDYLAAAFAAAGLEPGGQDGGYLATFEIATGVVRAAGTEVKLGGSAIDAAAFTPLGFSMNGSVTAEVVDVGYGLVSKDLKFDDYKGKNVKGKIVLVRRFVPNDTRLADDTVARRQGDLRQKAWIARERGAIGMIVFDDPQATSAPDVKMPPADKAGAIAPRPGKRAGAATRQPSAAEAAVTVADPAAHGGGAPAEHGGAPAPIVQLPRAPSEAPLPGLRPDLQGDAGIVAVVLTRAAAAPLLARSAKGARPLATLTVALEVTRARVANVVGRIAAVPPSTLPAIVVGAHYDHLGTGGHGSLAPDLTEAHNGADDNASGTAALLHVARALSGEGTRLSRDVWIVAFSGEEVGVLGSAAFVKALPGDLAKHGIYAMLNMDMVGRLRDGTLSVLGAESAKEWSALVPPLCQALGLRCTLSGNGYGPSDHMPFFAAGIPVLHFFTGAHSDYHKPSDDTAKINGAGLARVAQLVAQLAGALATRGEALSFVSSPAPPAGGDMRSFGASLGTVPDYAGPPAGKTGVLLSGVRPGSAADKGGLKRGDLLIRIDDHEIRSIEDFMFVLRAARPGQAATVVVEREGRKLSLPIVYGESKRAP